MTNNDTMNVEKSVALNEFLDYAETWVRGVVDDEEGSDDWRRVCKTIVERMTCGHCLDVEHPNHPLVRFSADDMISQRNLAQEIMSMFQEPRFRGIVHSFFHSGGMNHSEFNELWDEYLDFLWVLDDCEDDSENESQCE
jgi:hypothetical protein